MPRKREIGNLKNKRERLQGKNIEDRGMCSRREDSWRRKGCETKSERKCWKIDALCPKKMEMSLVPLMSWQVLGDSCGDHCGDSSGFSVCVPAMSLGVLVVTDVAVVTAVPVSPSSMCVLGEDFLSDPDCDLSSRGPLLSGKRQAFLTESQGGMPMEKSPEEVPPITGRKIQEVDCGVDHRWAAVHQAVGKKDAGLPEQMKVDAQELDFFCAGTPSEPNIDIKHMVMQPRGERRQRLFHALSQQGANEIMVASVASIKECSPYWNRRGKNSAKRLSK